MKNDSQQFILIPLLQVFNSSVVPCFCIRVCYLICVRRKTEFITFLIIVTFS